MRSLGLAVLFVVLHVARVVRVIDGDTVMVQTAYGGEKIRLLGIDCPETHANRECRVEGTCWDRQRGLEAAETAARLLPAGTPVVVDGTGRRDRYGRLLAYVSADGTDIGGYLLREGLCDDASARYPHPRQDAYRNLAPWPGR